jgi:microcystin-dependent protein
MATPFIAEIRMFGGNFAPRGHAFCSGAILPIAQNTALFSLLGTIYGGNGTSTFGLPDLRGRTPISQGSAPGLSSYVLGQTAGVETVTLTAQQMPSHTHSAAATTGAGNSNSPSGLTWAASVGGRTPLPLYSNTAPNTPMNPGAIQTAGNNQPHENRQPYLGINFIIATQGIFPSRN